LINLTVSKINYSDFAKQIIVMIHEWYRNNYAWCIFFSIYFQKTSCKLQYFKTNCLNILFLWHIKK